MAILNTDKTFGGLKEDQAFHWNEDTRAELYKIIHKMFTGTAAQKTSAYQDYYELKRKFFSDDWKNEVTKLDEYRKSIGQKSIAGMALKLQDEMAIYGCIIDNEIYPVGVLIIPKQKKEQFYQADFFSNSQAAVQMSLF